MTRNALLVASLLSAAAVTVALVFLKLDAEPQPVREVAAVRHHAATDVFEEGPRKRPESQTMVASYYASSLAGNPTASGEVYRPERYTAAHRRCRWGRS